MNRRFLLAGVTGVLIAATTLSAPGLAGKPKCLGKRATIVGTAKNERIVGTNGDDVIFGAGGHDVILGRKGIDLLCGGTGQDLLIGGLGGDRLSGDEGDDDLDGSAGNDQMMGGNGVDYAWFDRATSGVAVSLQDGTATGLGYDTLVSVEGVVGSDFNDVITGSPAADEVAAGSGNDTLSMGDGDDFVSGGQGDDSIDGGAGSSDTITFYYSEAAVWVDLAMNYASGEGTDALYNIEGAFGTSGADVLKGDAQSNGLFGVGGDDTLSGMSGADILEGADGHDSLYGGEGNDVLDGGPGNDGLDGGPGEDTCISPGTYMNCETVQTTPAWGPASTVVLDHRLRRDVGVLTDEGH